MSTFWRYWFHFWFSESFQPFRIFVFCLAFLAVLLFAKSALADELQLKPIKQGWCEDVERPCVLAIPISTEEYYFILDETGQKVIAVTKIGKDGKEVVIKGELPKPDEEKPDGDKSSI